MFANQERLVSKTVREHSNTAVQYSTLLYCTSISLFDNAYRVAFSILYSKKAPPPPLDTLVPPTISSTYELDNILLVGDTSYPHCSMSEAGAKGELCSEG